MNEKNILVESNRTSCVNDSCGLKANLTDAITEYYTNISITIFNILYTIVLLVGIIGNGFTTSIILLRRKVRRSIYIYTFNLVICDIVILAFYVPTQMKQIQNQLRWNMGEPLCKVVNVAISVPITCSIATLVSITIDRARALITPFQWRIESWKRAKYVLPVIWLLSTLVNMPLLILPRLQLYDDSSAYCVEGWPKKIHGNMFWTAIFVINFGFPLVVIVATYLLILVTVRHERHQHFQRFRSNLHNIFGSRMIKMVVGLIVVFFICSGCQHVVYFIFEYSHINIENETIGLLFGVSNFLVSLQAALNPFLYCKLHANLWNQCFRKELKKPLVEIARMSSYIVVKASIFEDFKEERCIGRLCKDCTEEHVTLKLPKPDKFYKKTEHDKMGIAFRNSVFNEQDKENEINEQSSLNSILEITQEDN